MKHLKTIFNTKYANNKKILQYQVTKLNLYQEPPAYPTRNSIRHLKSHSRRHREFKNSLVRARRLPEIPLQKCNYYSSPSTRDENFRRLLGSPRAFLFRALPLRLPQKLKRGRSRRHRCSGFTPVPNFSHERQRYIFFRGANSPSFPSFAAGVFLPFVLLYYE